MQAMRHQQRHRAAAAASPRHAALPARTSRSARPQHAAAACRCLQSDNQQSAGPSGHHAEIADVAPAATIRALQQQLALPSSRRSALALLIGATLAGQPAAALADGPSTSDSRELGPAPAVAFPAPPPVETPKVDDPSIYNYDFASDLPHNLRVKEYWQTITELRPKIWQQIAAQITASNFGQLSTNLNVAPTADLRAATLYIPWSLLQANEFNAASDTRKAYRDWDEHVKDLQRAAEAAERGEAEPQQVQQAFLLMSASLDAFLSTIPTKFIITPISLPSLPGLGGRDKDKDKDQQSGNGNANGNGAAAPASA